MLPTREHTTVGKAKDPIEKQAVRRVIDRVKKDGYLLGTDLLIDKYTIKSWAVLDLEQYCIYRDKSILKVAQMFVALETPDAIMDVLNDKIEITLVADAPKI